VNKAVRVNRVWNTVNEMLLSIVLPDILSNCSVIML